MVLSKGKALCFCWTPAALNTIYFQNMLSVNTSLLKVIDTELDQLWATLISFYVMVDHYLSSFIESASCIKSPILFVVMSKKN